MRAVKKIGAVQLRPDVGFKSAKNSAVISRQLLRDSRSLHQGQSISRRRRVETPCFLAQLQRYQSMLLGRPEVLIRSCFQGIRHSTLDYEATIAIPAQHSNLGMVLTKGDTSALILSTKMRHAIEQNRHMDRNHFEHLQFHDTDRTTP